jgi:hypothetical protein
MPVFSVLVCSSPLKSKPETLARGHGTERVFSQKDVLPYMEIGRRKRSRAQQFRVNSCAIFHLLA